MTFHIKTLREPQPVFPSYIIMQTTGMVDGQTVQTLKTLPDFYLGLDAHTMDLSFEDIERK